MYMSNILGQPEHPSHKPATAPAASQSPEMEAGPQEGETEERRPNTTWAAPLTKEEGKGGRRQEASVASPLRSAIGRREASG